ncbi:MAG: HD domain-containing protein [Gemmatimonadota bacterium]
MARVAELLGEWATELSLSPVQVHRWTAAGYLHDVLRDASREELEPWLEPRFRALPLSLLHGPAAATRLAAEGVDDEGFLRAVAFHTLGHPDLDRLGRALYMADFLEPGRQFRPRWRARLRARMPMEEGAVLREVLKARLVRLVEKGSPMRPETVGFWNRIVEERR